MATAFSGVVLSTEVQIEPFVRVPGGFSSNADTNRASEPITIRFLKPVKLFRVTTNQITNAGAAVELYNSNNELLARDVAPIKPNGTPQANNFTTQFTERDFADIAWARLIPPPNDYVDYQGFIIKVQQPDPETPVPLDPLPTPTPMASPVVAVIQPFPEPTPTPSNSAVAKFKTTFRVPVLVTIKPALPAIITQHIVSILVRPEETPSQTLELLYPLKIKPVPIQINLSDPIIKSAENFIKAALDIYVDEDRELKTLLNYGEDRQSVVLAYRPGLTPRSIQLKLLQPVPADVDINHSSFLVREVVASLIDKFRVRFTPPINYTPYLRPLNTNIEVNPQLGKHLKNVTLRRLALESGSFGTFDSANNISFENSILRQWYSDDFNSAELNIDFTNYENFVFYGSAELRLEAFKQKLLQLETLDAERLQFSGSVFTGSLASAGAIYLQRQSAELAKKKEDIIRGFDRYEQYLYFTPSGSNSPYSASFDYVDGGTEYNPIGYWPKDSVGNLYTVHGTEGQEWFATQKEIAARYDEFNLNYLVNTIPMHVREQQDNLAYITFVSMIGHFFDTIKPYIDQFPEINSRFLDPNQELSKDLVNEVAEALGFRLPTLNSIYNLSDLILGTEEDLPRRDYTVETYKRLLHNLPLFAKAKGTRTSLNVLLRTLGIPPEFLTVRESGTPTTGSYSIIEEFSTGVDFNRSNVSYIEVPVSASQRNPVTLQLNVSFATNAFMTVITGDDKWALRVRPNTSNDGFGRLEIISGSGNTLIAATNYQEVYDDELINITLQSDSTSSVLQVIKTDGTDLLFTDVVTLPSSFNTLWNNTQYAYIGGSGSLRLGGYDGTIDELRLWGTRLNNEVVTSSAFNPGVNFGNLYSDARENLYVQISLNGNNPINLSTIKNESPYSNKTNSPSLEFLNIENITTNSLSRYSRSIKQQSILMGPNAFITNKIKVFAEPVFNLDSISSDGSKLLSPRKSIVKIEQKRKQVGKNKITFGLSPVEVINQNIIKNIGYENVNRTIGLPSTYYTFNLSLDKLKNYYNKYYAIGVNFNQYVRILSQVSAVFDQVIDYFIPAKATFLRGVTIEQNILEKIRIPSIKNIRGYGAGARKTLQAPGSLTGSRADYGATFNVKQTIEVKNTLLPSGKINSVTANVEQPEPNITSNPALLKTGLSMSLAQELTAQYNNYSAAVDNKKKDLQSVYNTVTSSIDSTQIIQLNGSSVAHTARITAIDTQPIAVYNTITSSIDQKIPTIVSGSNLLHKATLDLYDNDKIVNSNFTTYIYQHIPWEEYRYSLINENNLVSSSLESPPRGVRARPNKLSKIDLKLNNVNKIKFNSMNKGSEGAEPFNRLYTRKLFDYEISTPRIGGNTSVYEQALYEIPPLADFKDFGVRTFFNNPDGIYAFAETKKNPVYPKPLNQSWDDSTQTFDNLLTWEYGGKYSTYDVVYQDVTADAIGLPLAQGEVTASAEYIRLKNIVDASKAGNGKYYVLITRPSYTAATDGSSYYLGQVPTYMPPSLDATNWQLLKFKPVEVRTPRRVVFDTFRVPEPRLNNFKTTTISIDTVINVPDRYVDTFSLSTVAANQRIVGELTIQNILALFAIQANNENLRIRLYRTSAARDADLSRSVNVLPTGSHGVLLDTTLNTSNVLQLSNPVPVLVAGGTPPKALIYYTIDNLSQTNKSGTILSLYYYALQIEPRVPTGYLRKHYRFYRDNSTATKRRNWIGCKNTVDTTIDGLPPVQIIISEGNELTVSPTITNEEIQTGGGGTLNVT
jgi:hypothetical protein